MSRWKSHASRPSPTRLAPAQAGEESQLSFSATRRALAWGAPPLPRLACMSECCAFLQGWWEFLLMIFCLRAVFRGLRQRKRVEISHIHFMSMPPAEALRAALMAAPRASSRSGATPDEKKQGMKM